MPSMPTVSSPSITSPSSPVIKRTETPQTSEQGQSNNAADKDGAKNSSKTGTDLSKTVTASSLINLNSLITNGTLSSLLEDGANTNSTSSLLSLSNLISGKTDINSLLNQNTAAPLADTSASSVLLNKIINQLTSLQEELDKIKKENKNSALQINTAKILRFSVNGYDILATCKTVYFSIPDKDGSFLCTADREYYANGIIRKETFYMLFSSDGKNNFNVAARVMQDYLNEYSFVYQLSQKSGVRAQKTGNLITIMIDDPVWKLDLLINLI